jgi:hypothetical protein
MPLTDGAGNLQGCSNVVAGMLCAESRDDALAKGMNISPPNTKRATDVAIPAMTA